MTDLLGFSVQEPPRVSEARNTALRMRAVPMLVLLVVEGVLGGQLAIVGSPYPIGYLAAHIVLAVLLVGFTGHAFQLALRLPKGSLKVAAAVTFLTTLGATVAGTVFLLGGGATSAFDAMEGLFGVALVGAILLLVLGSVVTPPPSPPPP